MRRLPAIKRLKQATLKTKESRKGVAFLLERREKLAAFDCIESFVASENTPGQLKEYRGVIRHLVHIRQRLARELWSRQLYLGETVLDGLLFEAFAHRTGADPIGDVLARIRDKRILRPGLIVFPVHSFGIRGAGLFQWAAKSPISFLDRRFGVAISPQTNCPNATLEFLDRVRSSLGVGPEFPRETVEHWMRCASTKWLTLNPLLAIRVQTFSGDFYENQSYLLFKMKISASKLALMAALQPAVSERDKLWCSSSISNFETLDINHYLVFSRIPGNRKTMWGERVPMNLDKPELAEISDLSIQLYPKWWHGRSRQASEINDALEYVHSEFVGSTLGRKRAPLPGPVFRKMMGSLDYFRRSFRQTPGNWHAIVNLAIAFEMLLTDHYSKGVKDRIVRRAKMLMKRRRGVRDLVKHVELLYVARNKVVHSGEVHDGELDMNYARRAYVYCLIALANSAVRAPGLSSLCSAPMAELIGDS